MSKLSEFYALRDSLANDSEVTDTQWNELEQKLIREEILPEVQEQLKCILSRVQSSLSIHVDYTPNENLAISCTPHCIQTSLSMCPNSSKSIDHPTVEVPVVEKVITEEPVETEDDTDDSEDAITRGPRQYFSVRLNGKMVEGKNGAQILARTIQQIGYKRVAALGIMFGDGKYNLVDRNQRTDDGLKWQQPMGEWFIYSNMSNPRKIAILQEIAQKLDLDMQVTPLEQDDTEEPPQLTPKTGSTNPQADKFRSYLDGNIASSTVRSYMSAMDVIGDYIHNEVDNTVRSVYDITDQHLMELCLEMLQQSPDFTEENNRRHNQLSATIGKYIKFLGL